MTDKKRLSHRPIVCFDCGEVISWGFNLQKHYERNHPGKPCREKGQTQLNFSLKRKLGENIVRGASVTSSQSSVKSSGSSISSESSVISSGSSVISSGSSVISSGSSETLVTSVTIPHEDATQSSVLAVLPSASPAQSSVLNSNALEICDDDLLQQMQSLLDQLKLRSSDGNSCNNDSILDKGESSRHVSLQNSDGVDELVNRVKMCVCLNELEVILGEDFTIDRILETLICNTCVPDFAIEKNQQKRNIPGIIKILDVESTKQKTQSREFRNFDYIH